MRVLRYRLRREKRKKIREGQRRVKVEEAEKEKVIEVQRRFKEKEKAN